MTTISIPDTMADQLRIVADETGASIADLVKDALVRYLAEKEEDRQDIEAARLALAEYERDGGGKPWAQVKQELGLR